MNEFDSPPIFFDALVISFGWFSNAGEIAVVREISQLYVSTNWVGGCASGKIFIVLALAFCHRVQRCDDLVGKAFASQSIEGPPGAILADIVQYSDDAFVRGRQPKHHAQGVQNVWNSRLVLNACVTLRRPPAENHLRRERDWRGVRSADVEACL